MSLKLIYYFMLGLFYVCRSKGHYSRNLLREGVFCSYLTFFNKTFIDKVP